MMAVLWFFVTLLLLIFGIVLYQVMAEAPARDDPAAAGSVLAFMASIPAFILFVAELVKYAS